MMENHILEQVHVLHTAILLTAIPAPHLDTKIHDRPIPLLYSLANLHKAQLLALDLQK